MITLEKRPLEGYVDTDHHGERQDGPLNVSVLAKSVLNAGRIGLLLEALLPQSGDRSDLAGMTSRRVTWTECNLMANSDSSKVRRMYRSGVVTTGSRSGEGVDSLGWLSVPREFDLLMESDRHGVANVDGDYISPTSRDLVERIGDRDPLVVDHDLRAYEDEVCKDHKQSGPECSGDATCEREVAEALIGIDRRSDRSKCEEDVAASRAKEFGIGHGAILSRGVMVTIESTRGVTR